MAATQDSRKIAECGPESHGSVLLKYFSIALAAAALLAGVILQSRVHLNHDVAWIGYSAGWLLDGAIFGVDILDPSPPLAWYLSLPAVALHRIGLLGEVSSIRFFFWTICAASLLLCFRVLAELSARGRGIERLVLLLAAAVTFCVFPTRDFGQRDVMALVLGLPYIFLVAGKLEFGRPARTSDAVAAGLAAGIGFSLKPFMLAIPVFIELYRLWRWHGWRIQFTPESTCILIVCALYGASVMIFSPGYVLTGVPVIKAVYWAYDPSAYWLTDRLKDSITPLLLGAGVAVATQSSNSFHGVIGVACVGAVVSYWTQGKGFTYHAFPILALGWIFLVYAALVGSRQIYLTVQHSLGGIVATLGLLALAVAVKSVLLYPVDRSLEWYRSYDIRDGARGRLQQSIIDELGHLGIGPGEYLYALTTHPGPAFPAVNYLGAEWAGPSATQFIIPAFVRRNELSDPEQVEIIEALAKRQTEEVVSAMTGHRPRVVLVDERPARLGLGARKFDYVDFYSQADQFRSIWACYSEASRIDGIVLFVRRGGCGGGAPRESARNGRT